MIVELQSAARSGPSRRERLDNLTRVEAVKLKVERAAFLFRGAPVAIGASALTALITLAVVWSDMDRSIMLYWTSAVFGLAALRAAIWLRYRLARPSGRNLARFAALHVFFMALNGALWGALAAIFSVHGLVGHTFLPFVVAGMSAAAVVSAGASWRAVVAFNLPALTPLGVAYAMTAGGDGLAIASGVALYGVATLILGVVMQRMVDRSILLHTRNVNLFDALQRQVDEAHLNEQRFRALVEASQDVTLIFSPSGKIIYASPSVEKAFGAAPHEMVGMTTKDLVHADDLSLFRAVGEKALSKIGEANSLSHVCMKGPGRAQYVALGGRLTNMLYVPGVEGFVFNGGVLRDVEKQALHAANV